MKRNWILSQIPDGVASLATELDLHPKIVALLLRRGLKDSAEIFSFLNPSLDSLESPFAFRDMSKAVERIRKALTQKEKVLLYGDYDVDGITGSAVLYLALKKMGAEIEGYIPHRHRDGYGLNKNSLELLIKKKYGLVITVDNGITGHEAIDFLKENGADTIVIDHHLPKGDLPGAYAILSACVGGSGDESLAACGLAFKMAWALAGDLEAVKDLLDLVVLGTVADLAPVTGENRILLKEGLKFLSSTKRPGLKALMGIAGIQKEKISYRDIAFGLGPRINASGRMGLPEEAFKLLVTENEFLAQNLAQVLDQGNRDRQRTELVAFEEAVERAERDFLGETEAILVLEDSGWNEGVIGIVAARLVERYHKPSIVISLKGDTGKGSGRSTSHHSLFDSVQKCEEYLLAFGGHARACGLTIETKKIPHFRRKLNQIAGASPFAAPALNIEAELSLADADIKFIGDLNRLAPFGPGNERPLFVSRGLRLRGTPKKRGQDTLQCWVTDGRTTCEAIGFRTYEKWRRTKFNETLDIVYEPTINDYNGIRTVELRLEDWR